MWMKVDNIWGEYFYRIKGTEIDPVKKGMQLFNDLKKPGKLFCKLNGKTKEVILVKIENQ